MSVSVFFYNTAVSVRFSVNRPMTAGMLVSRHGFGIETVFDGLVLGLGLGHIGLGLGLDLSRIGLAISISKIG
jgi:hypothetical protein